MERNTGPAVMAIHVQSLCSNDAVVTLQFVEVHSCLCLRCRWPSGHQHTVFTVVSMKAVWWRQREGRQCRRARQQCTFCTRTPVVTSS